MDRKLFITLFLIASIFVQLLPSAVVVISVGSISDIEGTIFERPISRLNSLGIMVGDDAGFRPDDNIKRSEFAAIIVRALGLEKSAAILKGETKFEDVASDHWAAGYINVAIANGIIKGTSEITFAPDDNITYEQAVTMVIRALGYELDANTKGGYPTGFMIVAHNIDIFNNVPDFGKQTDAATRGIVGFIVDNSLEIPLMTAGFLGTRNLYTVTGISKEAAIQTLLEDMLHINKYKGRITDIRTNSETDEVKLTLFVTESRNVEDAGKKFECKLPDYIKKSLNPERDTEAIISIYESEGNVYGIQFESETIFDYVQSINGKLSTSALNEPRTKIDSINNIELRKLNISFPVRKTDSDSINLYDNSIKIYDTLKYSGQGGYKAISINDDASELLGKFVKAVVYKNEIVHLSAYVLQEGGLIKEYNNQRIVFTKTQKENLMIDRALVNERLLILLDNKPANILDINQGYLFDYYKYENVLFIIASSGIVRDKLVGITEKDGGYVIKMGLDSFIMASNAFFSVDDGDSFNTNFDIISSLGGYNCLAYLDYKDEIRYVIGSSGVEIQPFIGVLKKAYSESENYISLVKYLDDGSFNEITVPAKIDAYKDAEARIKYSSNYIKAELANPDTQGFHTSIGDNSEKTGLGLIVRLTPNNKGEIIKVEGLAEEGWGFNKSASQEKNYLFPGDSRRTGTDVNPGESPNKLVDVINNGYFRFYMSQSAGEKRINFASNTKVVGIRDDNGEILIEPILSSQLANRRTDDIIGLSFHISGEYNVGFVESVNGNTDYYADFIVVYGVQNLHNGDMRWALFTDLERVSSDKFIGAYHEYNGSTTYIRNVIVDRTNVSCENILRNGETATLTDNSFIAFWRGMQPLTGTGDVAAEDEIKVAEIAPYADIKGEFENYRNGQKSVVQSVYSIDYGTFFRLSGGTSQAIDAEIQVYEFNSYNDTFTLSSFRNISAFDRVLLLRFREYDPASSRSLRIVIFERNY